MIRSSGSVFRYVLMSFLLCGSCMLGQSSDAIAIQRYSEEGQKALASGRYDDAEKAYEKLRDLEPRTAEVHANLGLIYFQQRKFEQAVPTLREALKLKPSLAKTETLLAMSLSELGRYSEALLGLQRGWRQSADPAIKRMSGLQLLRSYSGVREDSKAVEVALELNSLYPKDPEVLYSTAGILGRCAV